MFRGAWGPLLAGLPVLGATSALAQQTTLGISEAESASAFSSQTGRRLNFVCPAVTMPSTEIWGTDFYAHQSAICPAAIHAGVLAYGEAGTVSIVMGPTVDSFRGSTRNGVTTQSYDNGELSYTFVRPDTPAAIEWTTTALGLPRDYRQPVTVICPGDGNADSSVWGTDTYITDSAVCVAAVHAGVIGFAGGAITVTKVPGIENYTASTRNGVSTIAWTAWPEAFRVAASSAEAATMDSDGSRRIRLAGYTAAGDAAENVPRRIRLLGYSGIGTGSGADIQPRTIRTEGWTATSSGP